MHNFIYKWICKVSLISQTLFLSKMLWQYFSFSFLTNHKISKEQFSDVASNKSQRLESLTEKLHIPVEDKKNTLLQVLDDKVSNKVTSVASNIIQEVKNTFRVGWIVHFRTLWIIDRSRKWTCSLNYVQKICLIYLCLAWNSKMLSKKCLKKIVASSIVCISILAGFLFYMQSSLVVVYYDSIKFVAYFVHHKLCTCS